MNYQVAARRTAAKYGIPANLFLALVKWESGWRPGVVSPAGAIGLTQLMPGTARGMGIDPFNPLQNLDGGARYLSNAYKKFGSWKLALAAYNAGGGAVEKYGGVPPFAETQHYVKGILGSVDAVKALKRVAPARAVEHHLLTGPPDLSLFVMDNLSHIAQGSYSPEGALGALGQAVSTATPAGSPAIPTQTFSARRGKATPVEQQAVTLAMKFMGTPYVWGGSHPGGFDCSGLLYYVWGKKGVHIPRTTYDQWTAGHAVSRGQLRPGDAVFFTGSDPQGGKPGHVGMYIGNGKFLEAPHTGSSVHVSSLKGRTDYVGARRFA